MTMLALSGAPIFDGTRLRDGEAVLIDGGRIADIVTASDVPADAERHDVEGLIAPGFIDVQVNGGGGVLFNDARTVDGIAAIGAAHRRFGTTGFLPTLITDTREAMAEAVAAVRDGLIAGVPGLLGIHLEGPFLNPERKGVHQPKFMRAIEDEDVGLITGGERQDAGHAGAGNGVDPDDRPARLGRHHHLGRPHQGLVRDDPGRARRGFDRLHPPLQRHAAACRPRAGTGRCRPRRCAVLVRTDRRSLSTSRRRACAIAIAAKGWERMMLVTDAMSSVGSDLKSFVLHGRTVRREGGCLTTEEGTIAGSDLDMASAVRNTVDGLGLPLEAALHMASRAPAEFLGLGGELGRIAPGYRASLVLLDDDLNVRETWVDGKSYKAAESASTSTATF